MSRVNKGSKRVVRKRLNIKKTIFSIVFLSCCLVSLIIVCFKYVRINNHSIGELLDGIRDSVLSDKVLSMTSNLDKVYLAVGGTKKLSIDLQVMGEPDRTLIWSSNDENVATVSEEGVIKGVGVGTTDVVVKTNSGASLTISVLVTDLISVPKMGTPQKRKPTLPCERYTEEEAALLDEILESRIKEAGGEGTRGAVVAVMRFLLLEFPYEVRYFNENGRMNGRPGSLKIDAEGRYYHKGLYLSQSKYADVKISTKSGPAMWGCNLFDNMLGQYRPNGLTCSGFVSWALYNGGLDVGDVGAGDYTDLDNELSDLGPHQQITYEFMASNKYKVGDFIARDGHAALIMGMTEDTIYTAESLIPGVQTHIYGRYRGIVEVKNPDDKLTYIVDMDEVYPNGEGIYTEMWNDESTIN